MQKITYYQKILMGVILVIFGFPINGTANHTIDSLKQVYEASSDATQRIELLLELCSISCHQRQHKESYLYAEQAYEEAQETAIDTLVAQTQLKLAELQYRCGKLTESEEHANAAMIVFRKHQMSELEALGFNYLGIVNGMRRNNEKALEHFFEALKLTQKDLVKLRIYNNLVQIYQSTRKYGQALDYINKYTVIAEKSGDQNLILNARFLMATLYIRQRNLEKSQQYLKDIVPLVKTPRAKYRLADAYHNTATSLIQGKEYQKAMVYNEDALLLRKEIMDDLGLVNSYMNSGIINTKLQNYTTALGHFKEAWGRNKRLDNQHLSMVLNYGILEFLLDSMNTEYNESILADFEIGGLNQLIEQLEFSCDKTSDYCLSSSIHELLLDHFIENNNLEKALEYQKKIIQLKDSIFIQIQERSVSDFDFKLYTKDKENELSEKAHQIALLERDRLKTQALILCGAVAFLILSLILILINTKRKRLEKEKELSDIQLEKTQLVLQQKKQELTHFAEQIISKNTLIQQLEVDLEKATDVSASKDVQDKINLLRQQQILTQEDWDAFRNIFLEIYPSFMSRVQQEFNKLTPAELRMFMLLKLNLSKQQIAGVLGISPESVRKTKYRLKKKLNLTNEQDLEAFAQKFE